MMADETRDFVSSVIFDGGAFEDLFVADRTAAAPRLRAFYGADDAGLLPEGRRAGLLAHGSVLATYAHSDQTSPVRRGLFVRTRLLCQTFGVPPANAGGIPEIDPDATTRERFEQHSSDPTCASCHRYIDPVGFGFERFDAMARYRTEEHGLPIDASGVVTSPEALGTDGLFEFESLPELAQRARRHAGRALVLRRAELPLLEGGARERGRRLHARGARRALRGDGPQHPRAVRGPHPGAELHEEEVIMSRPTSPRSSLARPSRRRALLSLGARRARAALLRARAPLALTRGRGHRQARHLLLFPRWCARPEPERRALEVARHGRRDRLQLPIVLEPLASHAADCVFLNGLSLGSRPTRAATPAARRSCSRPPTAATARRSIRCSPSRSERARLGSTSCWARSRRPTTPRATNTSRTWRPGRASCRKTIPRRPSSCCSAACRARLARPASPRRPIRSRSA
jgi:hypothetical protein